MFRIGNIVSQFRLRGAAALLVIASFATAAYSNPGSGLQIRIGGPQVPTLDRNNIPKYFAGSDASLRILPRNADGSPHLIPVRDREKKTWPDQIELWIWTSDGFEHPDWVAQMNTRPFIMDMRQFGDSLIAKQFNRRYVSMDNEEYQCVFSIPVEAAGERIRIGARLSHPELGTLESKSDEIQIVLPRTEEDMNIVQSSWIIEADVAGHNARALSIADSLIAQGFGAGKAGLVGLERARFSAMKVSDYIRALTYLDLTMGLNGTYTSRIADDIDPQKYSFDMSPAAVRKRASKNRAGYLWYRQVISDKMQNQQQR